jgi:hypothetical protein
LPVQPNSQMTSLHCFLLPRAEPNISFSSY